MDATVARKIGGPLLLLNLIMYCILLGFASWCLDGYINGHTDHPSLGGNRATDHLLSFAMLASLLGIVSKFVGGNHRIWRNDNLAAASPSSIHAWAIMCLAFGLVCKEIHVGGWRGWRLRLVEAFIIILTFTQLIHMLLLHFVIFSSPGFRDSDYDVDVSAAEPLPKSTAAAPAVATAPAII